MKKSMNCRFLPYSFAFLMALASSAWATTHDSAQQASCDWAKQQEFAKFQKLADDSQIGADVQAFHINLSKELANKISNFLTSYKAQNATVMNAIQSGLIHDDDLRSAQLQKMSEALAIILPVLKATENDPHDKDVMNFCPPDSTVSGYFCTAGPGWKYGKDSTGDISVGYGSAVTLGVPNFSYDAKKGLILNFPNPDYRADERDHEAVNSASIPIADLNGDTLFKAIFNETPVIPLTPGDIRKKVAAETDKACFALEPDLAAVSNSQLSKGKDSSDSHSVSQSGAQTGVSGNLR